MNGYLRNTLYRLLHAEERNLADNQYDIIRAERKLAELKRERTEIEANIEAIKAQIQRIEKGEN
jgi:septal ring factor EnvC (AmiA/AmiB activator)